MQLSILLLSSVMIAPGCLAQVQGGVVSPVPSDRRLAFEVASVRENKSGGPATSNFPLDRGSVYSATGGVFSATNQALVTLLIFAYKIPITAFRGGLMRSLPGWAVTDQFDINARAGSETATKDDMRRMMQALLEERFKLRVHREERQMPVFGLYLIHPARMGPQLRAHDASSSCSVSMPPPGGEMDVVKMVGLWPPTCGDGTETRISRYRLREGGRDMPMRAIADWLTGSGESEHPIVDQTGLKGTFDFVLEFDPESLDREGVSKVPRDDSGPKFMDAVQEQLGLQVKRQEGSISLFVVDSVSYPSAN